MSLARGVALALFVAATPGGAQVLPVPGDGDPHLQVIDYQPGQIVQLRGAPGYQLLVELSLDEQIQSVAMGDSASWQVSINKTGDRLFLKPAQADVATNMTVVTSVRTYTFDLYALAGPAPDMPYTVQFRYPANEVLTDNVTLPRGGKYRISGDRLLRPKSVTHDGERTYITWPKSAPIPAIYTVNQSGAEVLVNGMMGKDDVFVVDGAPQLLSFRIDGARARADRVDGRKAH